MGTQSGWCTSDGMWQGDAIRWCVRGGDWAKKTKTRATGTRFWPTRCGWAHFWVVDIGAWCCGCSCCVAAANRAAAACWIRSCHLLTCPRSRPLVSAFVRICHRLHSPALHSPGVIHPAVCCRRSLFVSASDTNLVKTDN